MATFKTGFNFHLLAVTTVGLLCIVPHIKANVGTNGNNSVVLIKDKVENPILVCYWGTWSHYRLGAGQFRVENIDPNLCTHLVYSFFLLEEATSKVTYADAWLDLPSTYPGGGLDNIRKTIALRQGNRNLKITMAIGGWNEGSIKYSNMAADPAKRQVFISSIIEMIQLWDFDGIDMDWEYPGKRGGLAEDKQNFVLLLKELREALDQVARPGKDPLLLTSAFGCGQDTIDAAYDVPEISKYIDYFHLMLYDFKVYIDPSTPDFQPGGNLIGHHSPLYYKPLEDSTNQALTVSFAVETFIELGAPPEKLVIGVGTYGKTFRLYNESMHNFYDVAIGPGAAGDFTLEAGTNTYYEICLEIQRNRDEWKIGFDTDYSVPYAYSKTKWIGYDNEISAKAKVDYGMAKGVGGMMVWSLDFDDFGNHCGGWNGFPIVNAIKDRQALHRGKFQKQKESSKNT
ncbi:unnamed protein product [Orchesella dallaii]|uniref:GH18 domain-containing protein n=1 Tax=Orchesella dallaii TaxID=48710 RepID=A0ABP1QFM0_9HEXA